MTRARRPLIRRPSIRGRLRSFLGLILLGLVFPYPGGAKQEQIRNEPFVEGHARKEMVILTVTVTNKDGRPIANLKDDDFILLDEREQQQIAYFRYEDETASIGVLFDMSGSMVLGDTALINSAIEGVWHFVQRSNKSNKYFIAGFRGHNELLTDWTSDGNTIVESLKKLGSFSASKDGTALFDACLFGTEKVKGQSNTKHVLVLITDGLDNSSRHKLADVDRALKDSDTLVYTLGVVEKHPSALVPEGLNVLSELSSISGGVSYYPQTKKEVIDACGRMALELRHQYKIGFYPKGIQDGKWRRIKVEVRHVEVNDPTKPGKPPKRMNLSVRTRKGYYAQR